ncbi:MAG TPA: MFS transporter [Vineibacter sp.]|nr:MFS transporter [Vineibacter sp.]
MAAAGGLGGLIADRGFRRLWLIGAATGVMRWLDMVVAGIFVFDVTGSPAWVAIVAFMRSMPMIAGLMLGVLAARRPLARLMRIGLVTISATYAALAVLALLDLLTVWQVTLGALIVGIYWSSENSVRRTLISIAAGPENTGTAISFDWATISALRLAGPFIGGALYGVFGIGAAYLLGLACFAAALLLALGVPSQAPSITGAGRRLHQDIVDSIAAVRASPPIQGVLGVSLCLNFFGFTYASMVPVIGKEVLHATPADVGLLSSAEGLGAMAGAVVLTVLVRPAWFGRVFLAGSFGVALGAIGFGLSSAYALSAAALVLAGTGMAWFASMQSSLVLAHAPSDRRPGIMGVLTTTIGLGQLGSLQIGWLAGKIGAADAVLLNATLAVLALLTCAWLWPALWRR